MNLTLIISDNCEACDRAKKTLEEVLNNNTSINLTTIHKEKFTGKMISIIPALLINDKIFSYGDIDTDRLLKKIHGV